MNTYPSSEGWTHIGSTPKASLWASMNSTISAVGGRAPSRRNADPAVMSPTGRAGGRRGCSAWVAVGEAVGIIAALWSRLLLSIWERGDRHVDTVYRQPERIAGRARAGFGADFLLTLAPQTEAETEEEPTDEGS